MIPRSIFERIINEEACALLTKCAPDENTSSENIKTSTYSTPILTYVTNPRQTFSIDVEKARANQDSFYHIIAKLEEAVATHYIKTDAKIIHREDPIPNIQTLDLAPNDIELRLEKPGMMYDAIRNLKLIDQFLVAFIASDPVATLVPYQGKLWPDKTPISSFSINQLLKSSTVLLSDISLQKIDKAREKIQAENEQYKPKGDFTIWGLEI